MLCAGSALTPPVSCLIMSATSHRLFKTQAWIMTGGIIANVVVATPPTLPQPVAHSDGESEVRISEGELPSPREVISKVRWSDDVEHVLNKGVWATTGAMRRGWKIFIKVSVSPF